MWKLMFTGDLVTGFNRQQVTDNLAKLLNRNSEDITQELFNEAPVCFREVENEAEAHRWRRDFANNGALLMMLPGDEQTPFGSRYAGADPANINIAEPTIASVFARIPAVRRRNQAFLLIGMATLFIVIVSVLLIAIAR